jgi:hypothetical protein
MEQGRVRLGLSLATTFMHAEHDVLSIQREPGLALEDQPSRHALDAVMLMANLDAQIGLHRRFAVEASLPVRANRIRASFFDADGNELEGIDSIHHRDETIAGLADMMLGGRIGLVIPQDVARWNLDLRLAVAQPTGRVEPDPFSLSAGGIDHQHIFFGNGTFDPVVGLETRVLFDRWRLTGWMSSRLPVARNDYDYLGSRTVAAGVGVQSSFGLERWTFLAQPEIYWESPATWSQLPARNSGRTSLLATVGAFVSPADGWQLHAMASVPYYTTTINGDLRWPFLGVLGFSYSFSLAPEDEHDHDHGDAHDHGGDEHEHGDGSHPPDDGDHADETDHDDDHDHGDGLGRRIPTATAPPLIAAQDPVRTNSLPRRARRAPHAQP